MRELIKELPNSGMSVLVSSHLLSEIDQLATQIGIINNGKMIFQDSIVRLRQKRKPLLKVGVSDVIEAKTILKRKGLKVEMQKDFLWLAQTEPEFVQRSTPFLCIREFLCIGLKK
ncbi:ABC-type multidrug transport system ATPase subunit [Peribacillus simplex]|nr:ABC-type multidrug transport system ATPase subunit [Peribacillus simplex]